MAQLFPHYSNTVARVIIACAVLGIGALAGGTYAVYHSPLTTDVGHPVRQTVPFSHQHHVAGLGIDCRYCHTSVEKSSFAGIPSTEICMTCHSQVWQDAPILAPVRESWISGNRLRWNRVHDLPDYTYFNHSIHVQKGIACATCHGRVDQMPVVSKAESLYMRWCLDCHREPEQYVQSRNKVFAMEAKPEVKPVRGRELMQALGIKTVRLEDCSVCHR